MHLHVDELNLHSKDFFVCQNPRELVAIEIGQFNPVSLCRRVLMDQIWSKTDQIPLIYDFCGALRERSAYLMCTLGCIIKWGVLLKMGWGSPKSPFFHKFSFKINI